MYDSKHQEPYYPQVSYPPHYQPTNYIPSTEYHPSYSTPYYPEHSYYYPENPTYYHSPERNYPEYYHSSMPYYPHNVNPSPYAPPYEGEYSMGSSSRFGEGSRLMGSKVVSRTLIDPKTKQRIDLDLNIPESEAISRYIRKEYNENSGNYHGGLIKQKRMK